MTPAGTVYDETTAWRHHHHPKDRRLTTELMGVCHLQLVERCRGTADSNGDSNGHGRGQSPVAECGQSPEVTDVDGRRQTTCTELVGEASRRWRRVPGRAVADGLWRPTPDASPRRLASSIGSWQDLLDPQRRLFLGAHGPGDSCRGGTVHSLAHEVSSS
jgi:hypothetical protein